MTEGPRANATTVVIVHGAFVDGAGWQGVHAILRRDGYRVAIVQIPTESLAGDVAATKRVVARQAGPVLLVGHAYGGVVITEAGNDPKVVGLVYVAGLVPDEGECAASLLENSPLPAPQDGYLVLDEAKFPALLAADVAPEKAAFMAVSQVAWGLEAVNGTVGEPAWKAKPSWYLLAADDRLIHSAVQRSMSTRAGATLVEASGSHAIYVSHPIVVAALIEKAATEVGETER